MEQTDDLQKVISEMTASSESKNKEITDLKSSLHKERRAVEDLEKEKEE